MKKSSKKQTKKTDNVRVCVRVRPLNSHEKRSGDRPIIDNLDDQVYLRHHKKTKCFSFDDVFDNSHSQENIFVNLAKGMIETFVEGYNCCIFAYGQTGAGKTFTMQGELEDDQNRGVMPRSLNYLFFLMNEKLAKVKDSEETSEFIVKLTVIEIYNEVVYDLLAEGKGVKVNLREDIKKGVFLQGASEEIVGSFSEAQEVVGRGLANRHVGFTQANNNSSRSHSVVTVHLESRKKVGKQGPYSEDQVSSFQYSKFNFVDLAGSERQKHTKAKGKRLKEGCNINKSLTILGSVINSLASKRKNQFVRYRDSKLTFLLKDSLGGNSKTVFIANVSPSAMYYVETLSTLLFAQRAKMIKNKAVINKDIKGGNIERLRAELAKAKLELTTLQEKYRNLEESQMNGIEMKSVSDSFVKEQKVEVCEGENKKIKEIWEERRRVLENTVKDKYLVLSKTVQECLERLKFLASSRSPMKEEENFLKTEQGLKIEEEQVPSNLFPLTRTPKVEFISPFPSKIFIFLIQESPNFNSDQVSEIKLEENSKQDETSKYAPSLVNELMNICSIKEENCKLGPKLKTLNLESLVKVFENGLARIEKFIWFLGRGEMSLTDNLVAKQKDEFLERVMLEEEFEKMKNKIFMRKRENRILKEKIMIINLRTKELAKEKHQLRKDLDKKIYEKYEILKTIKKDYEQTKMENIKSIDKIDELERQKEVFQDGYHMFSEENERLRKEIRDLYSEKINWFKERDQMLTKLENLNLGKLKQSQKIVDVLSNFKPSSNLNHICQQVQTSVKKLENWSQIQSKKYNLSSITQNINQENYLKDKLNLNKDKPNSTLLKKLSGNSVIKGLILKNQVLKKENKKYFDFILELKTCLKLENNGIADRIMTLVEKNVDNMFLQSKLSSLKENSNLLKSQNQKYQTNMEETLGKLKKEMQGMKGLNQMLMKQTEVVFSENIRLKKTTRNLGAINVEFAKELVQSSQILQSLMNEAQNNISETSGILSKKFWKSLSTSLQEKTEGKQEIYPKDYHPEDQEFLLNLIQKSSQEANEERMMKVRDNLEDMQKYLDSEEKKESLGVLQGKGLKEQLKVNAEKIMTGLLSLWKQEKSEKQLMKVKMLSMVQSGNSLRKRDSMVN